MRNNLASHSRIQATWHESFGFGFFGRYIPLLFAAPLLHSVSMCKDKISNQLIPIVPFFGRFWQLCRDKVLAIIVISLVIHDRNEDTILYIESLELMLVLQAVTPEILEKFSI